MPSTEQIEAARAQLATMTTDLLRVELASTGVKSISEYLRQEAGSPTLTFEYLVFERAGPGFPWRYTGTR